ncbi:DNA-directed RNA polymerase sigma-70 factor [Streptomyces sp. NPDC051976]|uniref:DNA-directed RNA polymerase sigma-70 factor n=1 Tax=Streptomyces sp. NPDC051976 TaxID=3154947 RepID=UPI00342A4A3E
MSARRRSPRGSAPKRASAPPPAPGRKAPATPEPEPAPPPTPTRPKPAPPPRPGPRPTPPNPPKPPTSPKPEARAKGSTGPEPTKPTTAATRTRRTRTSRTAALADRTETSPAKAGAARTERAEPAERTAPEAAFDDLYVRHARGLVRQVEVLTGQPRLAGRAVGRAFDLAWQSWPEVARDPDPVGWVRAVAYGWALGPWQRWVPGNREGIRPPECALEAALLELPPEHRRAVLLHDGLGLDVVETAAESESSTAATAGRIVSAREALAEAVPEAAAGDISGPLTALLADAARDVAPPSAAAGVRDASEHGVRQRTVGAIAMTALIAAATVIALLVAPVRGADRPAPDKGPGTDAPGNPGNPGAPGVAVPLLPAEGGAAPLGPRPEQLRGIVRSLPIRNAVRPRPVRKAARPRTAPMTPTTRKDPAAPATRHRAVTWRGPAPLSGNGPTR